MRYALTAERMREAEEAAAGRLGITLADLMDRAGHQVAAHARAIAPEGAIVVLAGPGNNGGDGWIAARLLRAAGRDVTVVAPGGLPSSEPASSAAASAIQYGVTWQQGVPGSLRETLGDAGLLVDALFGFGSHGAPREPYATVIAAAADSAVPTLAVDVPSGVDSGTGAVDGAAVSAAVTLTFSAAKPGLLLFPGASHAGEVRVADIGLPEDLLGSPGDLEVWDAEDYSAVVPLPEPDTHKNRRGRVLVVAGSGAYPGAAVLAAMGAQRSGAGYVTLAAPESAAAVANVMLPSVVAVPLAENPSRTLASKAVDAVLALAAEHDAVVLGPGLTLAHGAVLLARSVAARVERPLVIDADGLNALADAMGLLAARTHPTVLTPHPGELSRLTRTSSAEVQRDRLSYGAMLAGGSLTCVLKGARTVVSGAERQVVDLEGTPALAHAGTGDVLAGIVGTLLAQGLDGLVSAALAVHVHGLAGRLASEAGSELAVTAEEVAASIPSALRRLTGR